MPNLVQLSQRVLDEKTCCRIDRTTGEELDEKAVKGAILLDMQTASVIVDSYDRLEDKSKFDVALSRAGALSLIHRLWDLYSR